MSKCNQQKCDRPASFRFTWPGRDEATICDQCVHKLIGVANAMGLPLQVIPLDGFDKARALIAELDQEDQKR